MMREEVEDQKGEPRISSGSFLGSSLGSKGAIMGQKGTKGGQRWSKRGAERE